MKKHFFLLKYEISKVISGINLVIISFQNCYSEKWREKQSLESLTSTITDPANHSAANG